MCQTKHRPCVGAQGRGTARPPRGSRHRGVSYRPNPQPGYRGNQATGAERPEVDERSCVGRQTLRTNTEVETRGSQGLVAVQGRVDGETHTKDGHSISSGLSSRHAPSNAPPNPPTASGRRRDDASQRAYKHTLTRFDANWRARGDTDTTKGWDETRKGGVMTEMEREEGGASREGGGSRRRGVRTEGVSRGLWRGGMCAHSFSGCLCRV